MPHCEMTAQFSPGPGPAPHPLAYFLLHLPPLTSYTICYMLYNVFPSPLQCWLHEVKDLR